MLGGAGLVELLEIDGEVAQMIGVEDEYYMWGHVVSD